ncbi:transposase [Streptomyces sp. AM 4-1-1]|nr:transposase [Streptomyces sp. AM 4-1-1]WEH37735.1 transposase [Streptomyces sp. AM 4-1-1]
MELRERAVRMYRTSDPKPQIRKLAVGLGVHPEALRGWIRQGEADAGERDDRLTTDEHAELVAPRSRPHAFCCRLQNCHALHVRSYRAHVTRVEAGENGRSGGIALLYQGYGGPELRH